MLLLSIYLLDEGMSFVETDSQAAKDLTKSPMDKSHPLASLMEDMKSLLDATGCTIQHTLREGNACADYLTNMGANQDNNLVHINEPTDDLKILIGMDSRGVSFLRGYVHQKNSSSYSFLGIPNYQNHINFDTTMMVS